MKVEVEHTPGPWTVREGHTNGEEVNTFGCIEGGADGYYVATVWADVEELAAEAPANARLIAAAPDLLAACKMLIAEGASNDAHKAVLAAISKAEGR